MSAHSKIGASSMYRWSACPGSVRLSEGIVSPASPYAKEGTKAHDMAAEWLEFHFYGKGALPDIPEDMKDAVKTYVRYIIDLIKDCGCEKTTEHVLIEHKFDLSSVHPGLFGTADAVFYDESKKTLHVIDYKHGQGLAVEVEGNKQLRYYGLGALLSTNFPVDNVVVTIVQPRCPHSDGPIRSWELSSLDMLEFSGELKEAALRTEDPNAPIIAGDHCRFCPANPKCPALHEKALEAAKTEFMPENYDGEKISDMLNWLPILESWIKNVREFAYREAQHGRAPKGFKLVEKRATRKWRLKEYEIFEALSGYVDESDMFDRKIKSPAQIEKLLGKAVAKTVMPDLIVNKSSGLTLVHESDPRKPADILSVEFTKIEGEL